MKIVIADTGAVISLGHIGHIDLVEAIFGDFFIACAVFKELVKYENPAFDKRILETLRAKTIKIKSRNYLSMIMDLGES